jgi:hypothetical protein
MTAPVTYYTVYKPTGTYGVVVDGNSAGRRVVYQNSDSIGVISANTLLSSGILIKGNKTIQCGIFNGASSFVSVNSPSGVSGQANTAVPTGLTIGAYTSLGSDDSASVAHVSVYSGAHDFTTRERIMKELGEQFNVNIYSPLDDKPLAYYDADYVRKYSATQVDRLYSLDNSGDANRHAKQDTAANMPTFTDNDPDFGGHRSLVFAGSAGHLLTGVFSSAMTHPITKYVVFKATNTASDDVIIDGLNGTNREFLSLYRNGGNSANWAGSQIILPTYPYNTPNIMTISCAGAASAMCINSLTAGVPGNITGASYKTGLTIGKAYGLASGYHGKIAVIAIYPGVHDTATRTRITRYLGAKYGITIT